MVKITASEFLHPASMGIHPPRGFVSLMAKRKNPKREFNPTKIRQWREFRDMTQAELGEKVGLSEGHISMLENGKRGYTQPTLEAIAKVLGCMVSDLIDHDPNIDGEEWEAWLEADTATRKKMVRLLLASQDNDNLGQ